MREICLGARARSGVEIEEDLGTGEFSGRLEAMPRYKNKGTWHKVRRRLY